MSALSDKYVFKKPVVRILIWLFDTLGGIVFFWQKWQKVPSAYRRILVMRVDQLGDVVMTLPAMAALEAAFPETQIDFVVGPWARELAETYVHHAYIFKHSYFGENVSRFHSFAEGIRLAWSLRKNRYDLAIDFRGDLRNAGFLFLTGARRRVGYGSAGGGFFYTDCLAEARGRHQVERNLECLKAVGVRVPQEIPKLKYRPPDPEAWQKKFSNLHDRARRPWIVMHIGSGYPSKRWPAANFFSLLDRMLGEGKGTVILTGHEKEESLVRPYFKERERLVNLIRKTSIAELCALIDQADLFVGNDSGPAHLAAALGKKTVVLFSGTNDWRVWQPRGNSVHVIHHEVPCSPCQERICPLPRHECMENITVDRVFNKIREVADV